MLCDRSTLCLKKNYRTMKRYSSKLDKFYSRVFWKFLPNIIKINRYNFQLYCFQVGSFFRDSTFSISCMYSSMLCRTWYSNVMEPVTEQSNELTKNIDVATAAGEWATLLICLKCIDLALGTSSRLTKLWLPSMWSDSASSYKILFNRTIRCQATWQKTMFPIWLPSWIWI